MLISELHGQRLMLTPVLLASKAVKSDLKYPRPAPPVLALSRSRWSNGGQNPKVVGSNPALVGDFSVWLCGPISFPMAGPRKG